MLKILDWAESSVLISSKIKAIKSELKIVVKVLDEPAFTKDWIEHHAKIVGYENLIIADNGSTNADSLELYRHYFDKVNIFKFSGSHNEIHWNSKFSSLFLAIEESCSKFAFIDVDERLILLKNGRCYNDHRIIELLREVKDDYIVPSIYLYNYTNSYDEFKHGIKNPDNFDLLSNNILWGKPILPSKFAGIDHGIHNIQYKGYDFDSKLTGQFFCQHLTEFPQQRLEANRKKLLSRKVIDPSFTIDEIINYDFSNFKNQDFMHLVEEIRKISLIDNQNIIKIEEQFFKINSAGDLLFINDVYEKNFEKFQSIASTIFQKQLADPLYDKYLPKLNQLNNTVKDLEGVFRFNSVEFLLERIKKIYI